MSEGTRASAADTADGLARSLAEMQARVRGLAAGVPGFVFIRIMSPDGTISYPYISDGVRPLLEFEPAEMGVNAKGCLHVIHWADRDAHLEAMSRSAAKGTPCIEEYRAITSTGEVRWLKGLSHPRREDDGTVLWDGVITDATEGKRAEIRLEMLMDHAADAILLLDEDGCIDLANAAAHRLFGFDAGELSYRDFQILLAEECRHPDLIAAEAVGKEHSIVDICALELEGLRKDGAVFPLELSTSEVRIEGQRLLVVIGRDITRRRNIEKALRESEQRLQAITANLPGMVFQRMMSPNGELRFTYVSDGSRQFLDIAPERLIAEPQLFLRALPAAERQRFFTLLGNSARTMEPLEEEMAVIGADGKRRWLHGQSRPSRNENGDIIWDGLMLDVSERRSAEQRLSFLAFHDPLTRLPNRAAFIDRLTAAREAARRNHTLLAVASLGIDRFGVVNATMGHAMGDQVLIAAADVVQAGLGPEDMMARASGDRFLLLLAGRSSQKELMDDIERLHAMTRATVAVGTDEFDISASTGAAFFPRDGEDAETLIRNADAALQLAKAQGSSSLHVFTKEMSDRAAKTMTLQTRLRRAAENGEFVAFYQPQIDLGTGTVVGMEALVRWMSPELGMVSPVDFIPIAEDSGLIDVIGETMLEQCARQNRAWQDMGLPAIPVAVNVSGRQFQNTRRLLAALERTLEISGLDPRWLEIELTESSAMRDADNAIAVVGQIRAMGLASAIDDFGTGYSSLSVLKRFPIQKLKIDRSFVMDVLNDANDAAIVAAIVAMAKALKLKVVAEGVEDRGQLEFLRSLGCDQMQGYFFSKPLPAAGMEQLLIEGRRLDLHSADERS